MFNLGFIGFGNMAEAITRGIRLNNKKIKILAYDISKERLKDARKFNVVSAKTECEVANSCKIVILSVKPNDLSFVLETIKNDIKKSSVLLSLAAGFNIATIEKIIGRKKIARLMPNLPSAYGKGLTAIKFKNVKDIEINKIIKLLKIFSVPMIIKKEDLFDSITSISGSGPAFFASYINALLLFAEKSGFNKQESEVLINQTLLGTLEYLKNSNIKPDKFIKMVSSPGGTTESGINNLRKLKFEKIILDTHIVAKNKSKEMQKKISNKERK